MKIDYKPESSRNNYYIGLPHREEGYTMHLFPVWLLMTGQIAFGVITGFLTYYFW